MRLVKPTLLAVAAAIAIPTVAEAGSITCPGAINGTTITRSFTVTTDPGTATCAGSGDGANDVNGSANDFFTPEWLAVDKDPETASSETATTDAWFTNTGTGGSSGSFSINPLAWSTYDRIIIAFKTGGGQTSPSWAAFELPFGETFGTWFTTPSTDGGGLSHVTWYAQLCDGPCDPPDIPEVPEPGTMLMLGTGLALLAARLRSRKA